MNTTKKLVILGICLMVCGLSFAKKTKKGEDVNPAMLHPEYGRMFSKNDYLMEIK